MFSYIKYVHLNRSLFIQQIGQLDKSETKLISYLARNQNTLDQTNETSRIRT